MDMNLARIWERGVDSLYDIIWFYKGKEIPLHKNTPQGLISSIDFHWHVNERNLQKFDINELFAHTQIIKWNDKQVLVSKKEYILFMILNHHGVRSSWDSLKYIVDLWMFLKTYGDDFQLVVKQFNMFKLYNIGLEMLNEKFQTNYNLEYKNKKIVEVLVKVWENVDKFREQRFSFNNIALKRKLTDGYFTWPRVLRSELMYVFKYNPHKPGKYVMFSGKYKLINSFKNFIRIKIWETQSKLLDKKRK